MELKERLLQCSKCEHKETNLKLGILCSLTKAKPDFIDTCESFEESLLEKQKNNAKEYVKKINNQDNSFNSELSGDDKKLTKDDMKSFLSELKNSEISNSNYTHNKRNTVTWKSVLGVIIFIIAVIRLVMLFI